MSAPHFLDIDMEPDQYRKLMPLFEAARQAKADGAMGVVLAQVHEMTARVAFIEHEYASEIQAIFARLAADLKAAKTAKAGAA